MEADNWISVKERFPEDGEKVIVWQNNLADEEYSRHHCAKFYSTDDMSFFTIYPAVFKSVYKSTKNFKSYDLEGDQCQVTHWMPLPQPPKTK